MKIAKKDALAWFRFFASLPEEEMLAMRDAARRYVPICDLRGI